MKQLFLLLSLFIVPVHAMEKPQPDRKELINAILDAINKDDVDRCRQLLDRKNSIDGKTPVELCPNGFFSAAEKKPAILKILLQNGLDPNLEIEGSHTTSPILISTIFGAHNHETIQLLLEYGADPQSYNYTQTRNPLLHMSTTHKVFNALHQAAQKKCRQCCLMLINQIRSQLTPEFRKNGKTLLLCLNHQGYYDPLVRNARIMLLPYLHTNFKELNIEPILGFLSMKDQHEKTAAHYFPKCSELDSKFYFQSTE